MRNIALIVRRELSSYVRTPSGYIIAALYLLINGVLFNSNLVMGDAPQLSSEVLQNYLMYAGGITACAACAFSMRLLAEERHSGTQVLLMTSPIRETEIVLGKFLASMAFLTILVLLSVYIPALIFVHGKVSWGHIAAGYGGMICVAGLALSIGMFASALVSHPFLSVIVTAVLVGLLHLVWYVAGKVEGPIGDIIAYMSFYFRHFTPFRRGLVQVSDLVYYASLIYFFLFAATRVLKSQRWQ